MRLVVNPEQQANAEESECDRNVCEPRKNKRTAAAPYIRRSQHSLYKVLISPVGAHSDKGGPEKAGEDGVLDRKHADDFLPAVLCSIKAGGNKIVKMKTAAPLHDFVPAAGNSGVEQCERDEIVADDTLSLNQVGPDHGFNAAKCRVNRG